MDRRDFLKLAGASGLTIATTPVLGEALARGDESAGNDLPSLAECGGKLLVMMSATGGWDPTLACDPKAHLNNSYEENMILEAGNIRYAPIGMEGEAFFANHYQQMLVVNGIDGRTNSHETGTKHTASGRMAGHYPAMTAIAAGFVAPHLPMSFLTFGGYATTAGLVAPTRQLTSNRVAELAHPDRTNFTLEDSPTYHSAKAHSLIRLTREARTQRMMAEQRLPRYAKSMDTLLTARLGADELQRLEAQLPEPAATSDQQRIQLMIAAMAAGICVAGNFSNGGFDTHTTHDASHIPRMNTFLGNADFLLQEAVRQGIEDRLVVALVSDFGRTPNYNDGAGKDHWPITSMIVVGAGVPGNRVVGLSDEGHHAINLDPDTLAPAAEDAEDFVRIGPDHVNKNIRRLMCLDGSDVDKAFPIHVEHDIDLLA